MEYREPRPAPSPYSVAAEPGRVEGIAVQKGSIGQTERQDLEVCTRQGCRNTQAAEGQTEHRPTEGLYTHLGYHCTAERPFIPEPTYRFSSLRSLLGESGVESHRERAVVWRVPLE